MKKAISLLLVTIMLFSFSACTSSKNFAVGGDKMIIEKFSDAMSVKEIFDDIKDIDLYHKMDTKGLTKETTENEDTSTTDIVYKDADGNTVYVTGKGYGEKFFKHHTKSASGKDIVCTYFNEGYDSLYIDSDFYHVDFTNLNKDKPFGAENVYVSSKIKNDFILSSQISYEYFDKWIPTYANYTDDKGYHIFSAWEETKGKFETDDRIQYECLKKPPMTKEWLLYDPAFEYDTEFVFGKHKFSYLLADPDQWYLTADFVLTFKTAQDRNAFMKSHDIKASETSGDENGETTLRTGEISIQIAKDCKGFDDAVKTIDINDYSYYTVTVNGKVIEISNGGTHSYY